MTEDTSRTSHYIGADYYKALSENFADWQTEESLVLDLALRESCRMLLEKEARLLDEGRHDDWLKLYAAECVYWVPATPGGGDPAQEVAVAFDDRRRLEDRVFRIQSEYAWSQQPNSRTSRIVSNVTLHATGDPGVFMARSNFLTTEFQDGDIRTYAGWTAHRLHSLGMGWEILVKQVNLINCDQNLRNPSITF